MFDELRKRLTRRLSRDEEAALAQRWSKVGHQAQKQMVNRGLAAIIRKRATPKVEQRFNEAVALLKETGNTGWYFRSLCDRVVQAAIEEAQDVPMERWWFARVANWQPGLIRAFADLYGLQKMCSEYIQAGVQSPTQS